MGHFYPRQTVLAPAGLITEPNEYGQYPPGALRLARNVTMREPGKLDQAPNVRGTVTVGDPDTAIHKLIPASDGVVYAIGRNAGAWAIFADGVLQTVPGAPPAFSSSGRISWAECNDRVILNGINGHIVHDPAPISTDFRAVGLPQVSIADVATSGMDGWFEPEQAVQYRVCLARRYLGSGDYTLRSAPSVPSRVNSAPAGGLSFNTIVRVKWPADAGVEPGDILELYRTDTLATNSIYADTGATYKLVKEYTLTPADIAAPPPGGLILEDVQPPIQGSLRVQGRELYTNPGVEGETYANLRPPMCQCLVSFKGFVFYGNTTDRAQLKFGIPGGWGWTEFASGAGIPNETARAKGIGHRAGAGTITGGSAVITGVSAADMVGVAVGQRWFGGDGFNLNDHVIAVGANTITMSANATMAGTTFALYDVIEINGVVYSMERVGKFFSTTNGLMEFQFDQPDVEIGVYQHSFEMKVMWNFYPDFHANMLVRASNGQNYSPPLPDLSGSAAAKLISPLTRKNRVVWSKEQQPEHAPSVSETFVGFGEIYAMNATRDAVWIWCSDGLHRLSGNGGSLGLGAWQTDYANATLLLCAPQASTVLDDMLYGYCNEGVVELDSAGNVRNLTAGVIGDILPGPRYREVLGIIAERNETDGEVLLTTGDSFEGETSERIYIYNARQKGWTYLERGEAGFGLSNITAIAMFRLPPDDGEPHVLFASYQPGLQPVYAHWNATDDFVDSSVQYQPLYGEDPLELKRWMWADYLFDKTSQGSIDVIWNDLSFGGIPLSLIDIGMYARAGCPREVGVSHSLSPGFRWRPTTTQRRFEGLSLAVKQRTNQPKERGA